MTAEMRKGALWLATICLTCLVSPLRPLAAKPGPTLNTRVPHISLVNTEGVLVSLSHHLRFPKRRQPLKPKKGVVLDFFRTDCAPCKKGLPKMAALHRKHSAEGILFLLVALLEDDQEEDDLIAYFKAHPLPFPVLIDAYGVVSKRYVATPNGGIRIPGIFIIDENGILRARFGAMDAKSFAEADAALDFIAGNVKSATGEKTKPAQKQKAPKPMPKGKGKR